MADDKSSDEKPKFDPFKPAEPRLPGIPEKKQAAAAPAPSEPGSAAAVPVEAAAAGPAWLPPQLRALPPAALYGAAGALALLLVLIVWMVVSSDEAPPPTPVTSSPAPAATQTALPAGSPAAEPAPDVVTLPAPVATTKEMAKAWSHKKFIIRQSGQRIPAMVLRLPGSAGSSAAYWGFTLQAPYGTCELELVTDLEKLAGDYGYRAQHPMVADPCTRAVFNPLSYGSIGASTFARGEVVRGTALRPPMAVQIRVQKGEVVAVRTE